MRWDNLFDDLESQLDHELGVEDIDLRAEEERLRRGRLSVRDRLIAMAGSGARGLGGTANVTSAAGAKFERMPGADSTGPMQLHAGQCVVGMRLISGQMILTVPDTFGKDWLAGEFLDESHRRSQCVVALGAIAAVLPSREQLLVSADDENQAAEGSRVTDRIGFPFVLRDLCRRRAAVEINTALGPLFGTIDRVGRDHLDLAVHEPGSVRREVNVSHYLIVPITQILFVRL